MIQSDSHIHTCFSSDSQAPMAEMVKRAKALGLSSLCFTDHIDYGFPEEKYHMSFLFSMQEYFDASKGVQEKNPDFLVRTGVELGLKEDILEDAAKLTAKHPFDFVIGSTHLVDNMDPYYDDYWEMHGEEAGIRRFYEVTRQNILLPFDFDVYGHIDYIIRYCPTMKKSRKNGTPNEAFYRHSLQQNKELLDEILITLIQNGKGIECNTAGLKYGLGHPNPHEAILSRYRELGGSILTIGSDAHETIHLAYGFEQIPALLSQCGFDSYTEFTARTAVQLPL
ncbi:MAG: histidinol-phosphatase HisJ family protein [Clostridiaceae bacterium]|nr:histidinol-phosphatase HisJ family protein [Clostridiaceae bacterium]